MRYFDYKKVAREACIPPPHLPRPFRSLKPVVASPLRIRHSSFVIPPAQLARLCNMIRKDFPADDMLYELHVLRACMPVRDGYAKIADILPPKPVVAPPRR